MRKALWIILIGIVAVIVVTAIALPLAVPPIARDLAERKLAELGYPATVRLSLGYGWHGGPELAGSLRAELTGTPWALRADFGVGLGEYHAQVKLPCTEFSEADPLLAKLLREHPIPAISNLVFSGNIALDAAVNRTHAMPVPVWTVKVPIRDVNVSLMAQDKKIAVNGFSCTPGASGIDRHIDIAPLFPRIASLTANGFTLTNIVASIRATEKSLMVNEARAGFCGGELALYSLFLDMKSLNTGFSLFLDDIDAGEALTHLNGFSGKAEGRLHGKIRLFVKEGGKAIRLNDAFLYSTPGECGKLMLDAPETVTDNLAMAGLDDATRGNIANALTDLDYTVLRLNLKRGEGKSATLSVRIDGTATRGSLTVPVDILLNINGELEQLINTGLGYSSLQKGKKK